MSGTKKIEPFYASSELSKMFNLDSETHQWLHGKCEVFAVAAHQVLGHPVGVLLEIRIPLDDRTAAVVGLCHAYVVDLATNSVFDAKGWRNLDTVIAEYATDFEHWTEVVTPEYAFGVVYPNMDFNGLITMPAIALELQEAKAFIKNLVNVTE